MPGNIQGGHSYIYLGNIRMLVPLDFCCMNVYVSGLCPSGTVLARQQGRPRLGNACCFSSSERKAHRPWDDALLPDVGVHIAAARQTVTCVGTSERCGAVPLLKLSYSSDPNVVGMFLCM